jgi:ABC-2 type transport system ATP-binding protein
MKSVSFHYKRKSPLFEGLELELAPDTIYGLLGKNGAGKTTLLKLMCGLLFPDGGDVEVLGFDPQLRHPDMLADIALVPEEFATPAVSVNDYRALYSPLYPRFDGKAFASYIGEFELDGAAKLSEMSYGQKKKALLAFALATNSRLLILDEPTNGLDIPSKGQLRRLLAGAASPDRIILVSTHQVRDIEGLIDPIVVLDEGRIVFNYDVETVSKRLNVGISSTEPDPTTVLYSEPAMGGYAVVEESVDGEASHVDVELLFNAVIRRPRDINRILTEGE